MERKFSRLIRCGGAAALTAALILPGSLTAYASSPSFARTDAEWAALKDNKMEYSELADLVHEYNATVQQNQIDYHQFRKDYGDTKNDVSDAYHDLASELRNDIDYPDSDASDYATRMASVLSAESTAKNLDTTGDNNLEDSEIKYINYELAEKTLVQTAQNNMISYHIGLLDIKNSELSKQLASENLAAAQAKAAVGSGTQVDVLTAQQNELNAEQAIIKSQSSLNTTKQKLQIMLGWAADASPEIGSIPDPDLSRIDSMNPINDKEKALENNYTLKSNKKKLANSTSQSQKDTYTSTVADNKDKIAASLNDAYQNVISARNSYISAQTKAQLTATTAAQTAQQFSLGLASQLANDTASISMQQAEIEFEQAKYNLREAMEAYDWAVNGLAST